MYFRIAYSQPWKACLNRFTLTLKRIWSNLAMSLSIEICWLSRWSSNHLKGVSSYPYDIESKTKLAPFWSGYPLLKLSPLGARRTKFYVCSINTPSIARRSCLNQSITVFSSFCCCWCPPAVTVHHRTTFLMSTWHALAGLPLLRLLLQNPRHPSCPLYDSEPIQYQISD